MNPLSIYLNFIKEKGQPLLEINPGSDEIALTVNDALEALDLLNACNIAVLGGDILTKDVNDNLTYAIHSWGYDYHYLNWYCDKIYNESQEDFIKRSYIVARESIKTANETAKRLDRKCYICLVLK